MAGHDIAEALKDSLGPNTVDVLGGKVREAGVGSRGHRGHLIGPAAELVRRRTARPEIPEPHEFNLARGERVHG
jgi:hypothetical protein